MSYSKVHLRACKRIFIPSPSYDQHRFIIFTIVIYFFNFYLSARKRVLVPSPSDDQHHGLPYDVTPAGVVPSGVLVKVHRSIENVIFFWLSTFWWWSFEVWDNMIFLVYNNLAVESEERFLKARAPPMPETWYSLASLAKNSLLLSVVMGSDVDCSDMMLGQS